MIGVDSPFHESFGFYVDPVDEKTATLPKGWKGRLVNLPAGDTGGVRGLCLEPHDLAIAKYVAAREKDLAFTRELARRRIVLQEKLLSLLEQTPIDSMTAEGLHDYVDLLQSGLAGLHGLLAATYFQREPSTDPVLLAG